MSWPFGGVMEVSSITLQSSHVQTDQEALLVVKQSLIQIFFSKQKCFITLKVLNMQDRVLIYFHLK
jgi:hypothetical protein